jgi:hypothetical protein
MLNPVFKNKQIPFMKKILLIFLFTPLFCYSQNVITIISLEKVVETVNTADVSEYELYNLKISPGYRDRSFTIEMIIIDSTGKEVMLSRPEINVNLIIHRTEYRMSDGKYEWDYMTEVKSNDIWTDEYIEIGDCSKSKHLDCLLRVKKTEKYKIKVYHGSKDPWVFEIGG